MSTAALKDGGPAAAEEPVPVMAWPLSHEQLDAMAKATWLTVWLGALYAALVVLPFTGLVSTTVIIGWTLAFVAIRALRVAAAARWRGLAPELRDAGPWSLWMLASAALQGAVWGFGSWWLMAPGHPAAEAALHLGLCMVALSNVQTLARTYPVLLVYTLAVALPLVARDLWIGGLHLMLGAMAALVAAYALFSGLQHARAFGEAQRQRRRNASLIDALQQEVRARTAAQALAERAHAEKAHFLAAAGHDLRQPLHAIGLLAQTLPREPDAEAIGLAAERIDRCVGQMAEIVDGLLELSRLDAGAVQPQPATVALEPLLGQVAAVHALTARAKGLGLEVAAEPGLLAHTDARLLRRVLDNLCANAVRYTQQGTVRLQADRDGERVRIAVSDTGCGIAPAELDRVFEPFYQVANPGRDHRQGHGLGLAIVQRLATLLDLGLELRSTPGQGTRVVLHLAGTTLPQTVSPGPVEERDDLLHGRRVLVVEDDPDSAAALTLLLTHWGCEVRQAEGLREALDHVRSGWRPDFVLSDLRLAEGGDGCRTAASLQDAVDAALPAVLVTGEPDHPWAAEARTAGYAVLTKPLRPARLRAVLNEAFARTEPA